MLVRWVEHFGRRFLPMIRPTAVGRWVDRRRGEQLLRTGPDWSDRRSIRRWLSAVARQTRPCPIPRSDHADTFHHLSEWLRDLHRAVPIPASDTAGHADTAQPPARRVLFVTSTWYWGLSALPTAIAMAGHGASVDFVWAPMGPADRNDPHEEYGPAVDDPFLECHPRFRSACLLSLAPDAVFAGDAETAEGIADIDVRHMSFRETLYLDKDQTALEYRSARNLSAITRIRRLLRTGRYDVVVTGNGGVYEMGAVFALARSMGVPVVSFDSHEQTGRLTVGVNRVCTQADTDGLWSAELHRTWTPQRERRIRDFLSARERPDWSAEGEYCWSGQPAAKEPTAELWHRLGLDPSKPTAVLGTNVTWDTAVLGRNRTFRSMADWVRATVRWFNARPQYQLIARVHPAEARVRNAEPTEQAVRSALGSGVTNIALVGPADPINTYALLEPAAVGLFYTTNVGLESACRGLRVITAGHAHYAMRGFTDDPSDPDRYFRLLEESLAKPCRIDDDRRRRALRYADVYFLQFPQPFPWTRLSEPFAVTDGFTMAEMLSDRCPETYRRTLRRLMAIETLDSSDG